MFLILANSEYLMPMRGRLLLGVKKTNFRNSMILSPWRMTISHINQWCFDGTDDRFADVSINIQEKKHKKLVLQHIITPNTLPRSRSASVNHTSIAYFVALFQTKPFSLRFLLLPFAKQRFLQRLKIISATLSYACLSVLVACLVTN